MIIINISVEELIEKSKHEAVNIIDIRDNYLYSLGSIPGSKNIPEQDLLYKLEYYLDKNNTYYLLCSNGRRSSRLANLLNNMGYKVYNIVGGYKKYLLEK